MSDLLKDTLARYKPRLQGCAQTVEVPIDQLERLAATIHRLQETAKEKIEMLEATSGGQKDQIANLGLRVA
jgi:hypothetical protein